MRRNGDRDLGENGERRERGKEICGEKGGYRKERNYGDMTHRSQRMFLLMGVGIL